MLSGIALLWAAIRPGTMGIAVALVILSGLTGPDGLPLPLAVTAIYLGAALAGLLVLLLEHGIRGAGWQVPKAARGRLAALALVNLVYVAAFWAATYGASPLAATVAGPLAVPVEILLLGLSWRRIVSRDHPEGHAKAEAGSLPFDAKDLAATLVLVAITLASSGAGGLEGLPGQVGLVLLLIVTSAANEALRTRLTRRQGDARSTVAAALVITVNSGVASLGFLVWTVLTGGLGAFRAVGGSSGPVLILVAMLIGALGVFLSQYAKQRTIAAPRGLAPEEAARLTLIYGAASIIGIVLLQLPLALGLVDPALLPWGGRPFIWMEGAGRDLEVLVSFATACLAVRGIVVRRRDRG